jgi:hypothetical protein
VLVDDVDRETVHALQYAKTVRARAVEAVHVRTDAARADAIVRRWHALAPGVELRVIGGRDLADAIATHVGGMPSEDDVIVIVPTSAPRDRAERLRERRLERRLARVLLPYANARLTVVRDHDGDPAGNGATLLPRRSHVVYVLVDRVDRACLRAIRYARCLGADEVRAVHAAVDPDAVEPLVDRWMTLGLPIALDVIECFDRNIPRALEHEIVGAADARSEVTVVVPRRDFVQRRQRILHDRTSRGITRALGRYPHIDIALVPYLVGGDERGAGAPATRPAEPAGTTAKR